MKEQFKSGLLVGVAVLLVFNTYLLLTANTNESYVPGSGTRSDQANANLSTSGSQDQTAQSPGTPSFDPAASAKKAEPAKPPTKINFGTNKHDFGTIKQDTENAYIFKFTNTGDKELVITNAKGSCGCTVPEYPKEPIAPGAEGEIKVVYKPGKQKGKQTKTVTLTANTEPAQTLLTISANVEELPTEEEAE